LEGRRVPSGFSTYLGGSQDDYGHGIAVDSAGATFITTQTDSPDFPHTVGSYHGGFDIAVTKLAPDGSLLWSGLYGGSGDESAALSLDSAGNVYLTGGTNSADFPTTPGAYDPTFHGTVSNAFVMKVDGATGDLVYSTFLAGTASAYGTAIDEGYSIAVDAAGDAYVVGQTVDTDFPVTAGAFQSAYGGGANDAFVAELNPGGSGLVYSTYLGGGGYDYGTRISVDSAGDAYVGGETTSTDFPTTAGAFQTTIHGTEAAFVAKVLPGGTALGYSTLIGGSSGEIDTTGLAVDSNGAAYLAGLTRSMTDFPTTTGAFQTTDFGSDEAFVTKVDPTGGSLDYSTFLGGTGADDAYGLTVDGSGRAFVTGNTGSSDFPTTAGAPATTLNGVGDGFVTELNSAGSALAYSTYLGGGGADSGESVALDGLGNAYVAGDTNSADFPTSPGAYQPALAGGNDAFVTQLPTGAAATVTINQAAGQADPTNASPIAFDVVFSAPVTGFGSAGVDLSTSTAAGSLQASVTGSGSHYTVTVTGMNGPGTVVAKVKAGAALDPSGNPTPASTSTDNTVTFDNVPPNVTVNQDGSQADPTNMNPIVFDVQFSEQVVGFGNSSVTLGGTLAAFASYTVSAGAAPNSYVVQVTVSGSHTGTVTASVAAGAVTDLAGNRNTASTSTDNMVTFDNQPPTVTVTPAAGQGATVGGTSVVFDVAFSEPVVGFTAASLDTTDTNAAGATFTVTDSGDHTNFTVTASGMTGGGTIDVTVDAGVVTDPAGNSNIGSNTGSVNYLHSGSIQFSAPKYAINEQGSPILIVHVTRTGGSDGPLTVNYATSDGTAVAGTDYKAETDTLTWAAGMTADQTIQIPILDDADFDADTAFSVGLSTISLTGALGSPSAATVNIFEEAGLSFAAAGVNTVKANGNVTLVVHRLFDSNGAITVGYATSDGAGTAGQDYTTTNGTLSWNTGDNTDRTITVPLIDNGLSDGRETFTVTLSIATGNALVGPTGTATVTIAPAHGTTIVGSAKVHTSKFSEDTTATGDQVTVGLGGGVGTLTYYLTNGKGPISEIDLSGTDPTKSTVTIKVKKPKGGTGDGRVGIGEVNGTGFKSFMAKTGDVTGLGFNLTGYAGSIIVGNVSGGADFQLPGALPAKAKGVSITAGTFGNGTDITSAAPIKGITAIAVGTGGTITAPSVGSITVKGQKAFKTLPAVSGDFGSDVTISGVGVDPVRGRALGSLRVAGTVTSPLISVSGNVGSVSVGKFDDSRLFAGYAGADDGSGAFNGSATVGRFQANGATSAFAHSFVIASNIKSVSLVSADPENSGIKFGFIFQHVFGGMAVLSPKLSYNKMLGGTQLLDGNLEVKQI
jgi:hypothetical protein